MPPLVVALLTVTLSSPFIAGRAEPVADSPEVALGVVLERGADVVVAHVIYAGGISEVVALQASDTGEWLGAFEPRRGAIPQVRFEAVFPDGETALSASTSLIALGVPEAMLLGESADVEQAETPARSAVRWLPLSLALLSGLAVLFGVLWWTTKPALDE